MALGRAVGGTWRTDANLAKAEVLWNDGLSASQIAFRIGGDCTKSAIIGTAHRRGWEARPSPITFATSPRAPKPTKRVIGPTLPPLSPDAARPCGQSGGSVAPERDPPAPRPAPAAPTVVALPARLPPPLFRTCQYPLNDRRPWRFCDAPTTAGSPYCATHHDRCYARTARQEAA